LSELGSRTECGAELSTKRRPEKMPRPVAPNPHCHTVFGSSALKGMGRKHRLVHHERMTFARLDARPCSKPHDWLVALGLGALLSAAAGCGSSDDTTPGSSGVGGAGAATATTTSSQGGMAGSAGHGAGPVGGGGASGGQGGGPSWSEPPVALEELDLGTEPLGQPILFPVPDRTLGFTVLTAAPASEQVIGIYQLRHASDSSVIFNFAMAGHTLQVFGDQGWCSCADPQSDSADAMPVQSGQWRVLLGSDGSASEATVRIWARRTLDGAFHGGVVDVNVFVAPGTVDQSYLSQVLAGLFPWAGLDVGTVQYLALSSDYSFVANQAAYRQMLMTSANVGSEPALNYFVVGGFGGELQGAAGVAGGIPGSPMQHGTSRSGVAFIPTGNPAYDAVILTHETGHIGGLFHTSEMDVQETDPLSDTVECDWTTMQNNPGACPDVSNVMFPIAYGATAFSPAQLKVVEGSAIYRGILQQGGQPSGPLPMILPPGSQPPLPLGTIAPVRGGILPTAWRPARDPLERLLYAGWCPRAGDTEALALRLAGQGARQRLAAIARDAAAFDVARARALRLLEREAGGEPAALRSVGELAASLLVAATSGHQLRLAALDLLARRDPAGLGVAAARLAPGTDATVDVRLHRLGLR
jgi:hypothetical protein